jgi:hypothetical protein
MRKTNLTYLSILLGAVFFTAALASFKSVKQDRKFTIVLNEQEINVVLQGLSELPLKQSQPVYSTIMQQAQSQLQLLQQNSSQLDVKFKKDSTNKSKMP